MTNDSQDPNESPHKRHVELSSNGALCKLRIDGTDISHAVTAFRVTRPISGTVRMEIDVAPRRFDWNGTAEVVLLVACPICGAQVTCNHGNAEQETKEHRTDGTHPSR